MYDSASRRRFPNRGKHAATLVRVVKSAAGRRDIARGYERVRAAACDLFPLDARLAAGLVKSVSGDNQPGLRRFSDAGSIRHESLLRCASHLATAITRSLLFRDRHRAPSIVGQPRRLPSDELAGGAPALQNRFSRQDVWRIVRMQIRAA